MPKNLGLYNNDLSVPRRQDVDAVATRVSTNEDNIAMLDSDMESAQSDIAALKGNVTTLTNALGSKQDTITGGASTVTDSNLTASRALVSNASGKIAVSDVTATELGYLDGVTSNVQTQVDGKVSKAGDTMTGNLTVGSAKLETNGYVTGTWLKTTANVALSTAASKIAVLDNGWVYSRTPAQIKSDIGLGNVDNVKQYSIDNPPPYPVTSVNSKTGAVTLAKGDVGLGNVDNVKQYSVSNPPPYPVTSVNGQTGAVTVEAGGGTTIVLSSTQPSGLKAGDYWYQIVT